MGEVWLGLDRDSKQTVAVKLIHQEISGPCDPKELADRFNREARLLAQLKHTGIPAFLDARLGPSHDRPYLVMEYVLGRDLAEIIGEGRRFTEQEVVSIAVQICDVLEYTHAVPVIHRDIKPANLMLTGDQRVIVLDFGVARMFRTDQARLTQGNRVLGTVTYMPPEQLEGRDVTPRSDLYSLSCVLYELLTGQPPFSGDDVPSVMLKHLKRAPNPVGLLCPGVDPVLEEVIMAGLAKRMSDRPASAQEFREQLNLVGRNVVGPSNPASQNYARVIAPAVPSDPLPLNVRLAQAQVLFEGGRIGEALPRFAHLTGELEALGREYAEKAAWCRFRHGCCLAHLGHLKEALNHLRTLVDDLASCRASDDRLLLKVRFRIGQLLLDENDGHGIIEIAAVFQALKDANRPEDTDFYATVSRALLHTAFWSQ
ncbi:hypothetical protein BG452_07080 [Streptomyces sp. CBMA123]|nr:hypothetical protein [Streptomyces sp. CBMA123]